MAKNLYTINIILIFISLVLFSCSNPIGSDNVPGSVGISSSNNGIAQWAKSTTGTSSDSLFDGSLDIDASGNIYATVSLSGTGSCSFGGNVSVTRPNSSASGALVKYNSIGEAQWAKAPISGTGASYYRGIRADYSGNTLVVGSVSGTGSYDFGNGSKATGGNASQNAFICKYNSSGLAQWVSTSLNGSISSYFYDVAFDKLGNSYAVGTIYGTGDCNFGNGVILSGLYSGPSGGSTCILVKYDANGQAVWGRTLNSATKESNYHGISLDNAGNIYIVGAFAAGTYNFGNAVSATVSLNTNGVLVKYDSSGKPLWARTLIGGGSASTFAGLAVDSSGNCYISGYISSLSNFGNNVSTTSTLYRTAFVAKYNSDGLAQWANSVQFSHTDSEFSSLSIDREGNAYAVGYISGTQGFNFGNDINLVGPNYTNSLLVKYDGSGFAQWAKSVSLDSPLLSNFYCSKVSPSGDLLVAGRIEGNSAAYGFGNKVAAKGASAQNNAILVMYK